MNMIFIGKDLATNELVTGYLVRARGRTYLINDMETSNDYDEGTDLFATEWYEVEPESVNLYEGLGE